MLKAISNSYLGLRSCQQLLDVAAHNLANVNSIAFKEKLVSFQELPSRPLAERRLPVAETSSFSPLGGRGVMLSSTASLWEEATYEFTKSQWDLAIEGEGFFRVAMPDGSYAYTRKGNFTLDPEGNFTLSGGARLELKLDMQELEAKIDFSSLAVSPDGKLNALTVLEGEEELQPSLNEEERGVARVVELGTIMIYRFTNPQGLSHLGGGLLLPSANSGRPQEGVAGEKGFGKIRQGFLENSNVDLGRQMSMLIRGQRALQASARTLTTADELWGLTLHLQS